MKKSQPKKKNRKVILFSDHVRKFMERAQLFPPSGKGFVAVSGGLDSVVLLHVLQEIFRGREMSLSILHVNHRTRAGNEEEARGVEGLAEKYGLAFKEKILSPWEKKGNFEHRARELRYEFFHEVAGPGDRVYTGHQLNDSLEWSLLQQFRSSSLHPILGIPVRNGIFARPFLCVTREQIQKVATYWKLPFWDDPSNGDLHFQRNFLRHQLIAPLKERFPSSLKHYVVRSNALAKEWGLSVLDRPANGPSFLSFQAPLETLGFLQERGKGPWRGPLEEKVRAAIHRLSGEKRGVLSGQIRKMVEAAPKGKWGPLLFSGGVQGYMFPGMLGLMKVGTREDYLRRDQEWRERLEKEGWETLFSSREYTSQEFRHRLLKRLKAQGVPQDLSDFFPFWVVSGQKKRMDSLLPTLKKAHPLWPQTTEYFRERGCWFRSAGEVLAAFWKIDEKNRLLGNRKEMTYPLAF